MASLGGFAEMLKQSLRGSSDRNTQPTTSKPIEIGPQPVAQLPQPVVYAGVDPKPLKLLPSGPESTESSDDLRRLVGNVRFS
jgi:hypothetical protein